MILISKWQWDVVKGSRDGNKKETMITEKFNRQTIAN